MKENYSLNDAGAICAGIALYQRVCGYICCVKPFPCLAVAAFILFSFACNEPARQSGAVSTSPDTVVIGNKDSLLREYGRQILTAARDSDFETIAQFIHPNEPLWFVPYGYIDIFGAQQLTAESLQKTAANNVLLIWGDYHGSDEPIKMKPREYLRRFVYPADFLNANSVGLNKRFQLGSSKDNTAEIFPNSDVLEYYMTGKEPDGKDWSSLRLVFGWQHGKYYLLAFIHDGGTI